jgi:VanZ family protein
MSQLPYPSRRSAWLLTLATFGYACVLFWATHAPDVRPPSLGPPGVPSDKVFHFLGYAALAFLATLCLIAWRGRQNVVIIAAVSLAGIAGLDELTQPLTHRDAELADWCADVVGALVGAFVALRLFSVVRRSG